MYFRNYGLQKTWLDKCLKSAIEEYPSISNMVIAPKTLFKSEQRQSYQIYWSLWKQQSLKKSLLVILKILGLFVNTFTAYDKYFVLNREYLTHPIHMQLSQTQENFLNFFLHFWNLD